MGGQLIIIRMEKKEVPRYLQRDDPGWCGGIWIWGDSAQRKKRERGNRVDSKATKARHSGNCITEKETENDRENEIRGKRLVGKQKKGETDT